jgi:16S rRNA (cytidine1402-2'-O)-methyltransferase
MDNPGVLYIVATHIGNPADITLRALEILRSVDAVICEEMRLGSTLLKKIGLPEKSLITLNEHNEKTRTPEILIRLAQGQTLALVSDCGTPVFADPGHTLIGEVSTAGFKVIPIPGPSSLMTALSILDEKPDQFVFGGFLPRVTAQREAELKRLMNFRMTVILMDTPYRLNALLEEVSHIFGKEIRVTLACDLTLANESIYRGSLSDIRKKVQNRKSEFILILHKPASSQPKTRH